MEKTYNFIDVFSGCGGLSYGLEQSGLNCLLGIDHDRDAMKTFERNHPNSQSFCGDIRELDNAKIMEMVGNQKVDLIVGGPPCQGFSTVGKGKSEDPRNLLFLEFLRLVKLFKPQGILIENVTGLLAKKNKDVLTRVFDEFHQLGYNVDARVLSAEEFGVPEKRRRTIIVGFKNEFEPSFPNPTHGARGTQPLKTVAEAFSSISKDANHHLVEKAQLKNELDKKRLSHIPQGEGIRYQRDEIRLLPSELHYNVNWQELRESRFRQTRLQRLNLEEQAPTILTSRTMYFHPTENRYLTAREAAAIQSFPNEFSFEGSTTSVFKQIGNAVPVELAKTLGLHLQRILNHEVSSTNKVEDFKKYAFHYNKQIAI